MKRAAKLAGHIRYDDLPDMCTPEEARRFLQIGRNTIYDLVKSGRIPALTFGKLIRIPKQALLQSNNGWRRRGAPWKPRGTRRRRGGSN